MATPTSPDSAVRRIPNGAPLLIIDDNPDHALLIQHAAQESIPTVRSVVAGSEEEALAYLEQCRTDKKKVPKLILLDLYLPRRENGWHMLEQIRQMADVLGMVPVVLISYSMSRQDVNEAYDRGCTSYLAKPDAQEDWLTYFKTVRTYWWETVTLPDTHGNF